MVERWDRQTVKGHECQAKVWRSSSEGKVRLEKFLNKKMIKLICMLTRGTKET